MIIDGQCHCGFITYEADVDPEQVKICHCTDCQTLSGTAFRTVVPAAAEKFHLLSGKPKIYVKTAESGNKRIQGFCPECGTPIYASAAVDEPTVFILRVGTIRQRNSLSPKTQYWCRSAQRWLADLKSIKQVDRE